MILSVPGGESLSAQRGVKKKSGPRRSLAKRKTGKDLAPSAITNLVKVFSGKRKIGEILKNETENYGVYGYWI